MPAAYLVNPYDSEGLKRAILGALSASPAEERRRMRSLRRSVRTWTSGGAGLTPSWAARTGEHDEDPIPARQPASTARENCKQQKGERRCRNKVGVPSANVSTTTSKRGSLIEEIPKL